MEWWPFARAACHRLQLRWLRAALAAAHASWLAAGCTAGSGGGGASAAGGCAGLDEATDWVAKEPQLERRVLCRLTVSLDPPWLEPCGPRPYHGCGGAAPAPPRVVNGR